MAFFDFVDRIPGYADSGTNADRMNKRHAMLIAPFADHLNGARVLDLGAHDGRWAYALAGAGAGEVVAIEGRQSAIDRFALLPDAPFKSRVSMRQGDLWDAVEGFVAQGETFDVVALFGIYYHIMDHFRLLKLIQQLGAKLVLVDSEFALGHGATITLVMEDTGKASNATPQVEGQARAVVGIPSFTAMERMAEAVGYDCHWDNTQKRFAEDRAGLGDYFRPDRKRRAFCYLMPKG